MELSGYSLDRLREDGEFVLYRAHTRRTEPPSVLLLVPAASRPGPETLGKINHEYSLAEYLDSAWSARPIAISELESRTALVLEDLGGEPLNRSLSGAMETARFLSVAVGLAAALGALHKRGLVHKDLKPPHVLVDTDADRVRLTGFGIASRLPREHQSPEPPDLIAGSLPYMAPEQTGRMNRSIDSRSDLYALGVTLYEMLTGGLPFTASDALEWVHSHIAKRAVPPHEIRQDVPVSISAIVMKLLAKTPEERYQTAAGVESDLRHCLTEWKAHHSVADFQLGQLDAPDRLLIPEKLYGRDEEITTLLSAFERVAAGGRPELVLVSGYSGVGKSAVVNELHRSLVPPRGIFASGKFDRYKRDIPYTTLAQAFQGLLKQLLGKDEAELSIWRDALREALEPNAQLIIGLVPELKAIIGEQPAVAELPQREAQARLHLVLRRFINVFARPEHPLALFLDDLQWHDAPTLDLIADLLTQPDENNLLFIGAYRSNEVDPSHPLCRRLEAMRQAGAILQNIVLAPLTREDLNQFVADSLRCEPAYAAPLVELVHEKTSGNPFFANQFISALYKEELLTFDYASGRWHWDLREIEAKDYTDNVVDLMIRMLTRLSPEAQSALKQLACLGSKAEFATVSMVYGESTEQIHATVAEAIGAGFLIRLKDAYQFMHDRVQEAAYSLIPQEMRAETHLRIGMAMADNTPPDKLEDTVFEIVNQLNRGRYLIPSVAERERIAELNLIAARRAKNSTAYASAINYLLAALELLTSDGWDRHRDLIFAIECLLAECEFLTAAMEAAEARLSALAMRAHSDREVAQVTRLRLTLYTALGRSDRAVDVFLEYLRDRGINWCAHPSEEEVSREYRQLWSLLGQRQIEELIDSPLMTDTDLLDTLDVFTCAVSPALLTDPNLLSLLIFQMVRLSLEHGVSDGSSYAYVWLGMIAGARFGEYPAGYRFGKLGYDLVEKRGLRRYQARTYLPFGTLVMPWTKHVRKGRDLQQRCFEVANRTGDLTYAAFSCFVLYTNLFASGDRLDEVQREAETGLALASKVRFGLAVDSITAQLGLIRMLRGQTAQFGAFNDPNFDESGFERHLRASDALALPECWYWIRKLQARFFAGDHVAAVEASSNAERFLARSPSFFELAEYHFYSALSRAALCDSATGDKRQVHWAAAAAHQKQQQIWEQHCPENFENRAALVAAEMARLEGRPLEAEQLYEKAIRSAHNNGFIHHEAIAYEVASRFYAARGFDKFADAYMLEARYCYQRWGADGKVAQLDRLHPSLKRSSSTQVGPGAIMAPAELLDLATVIGIFQAVSGEMVPEKLIDRLMRTAVEHAGADRGLLILSRDGQLKAQAEATVSGRDVTVHQQISTIGKIVLPESVMRYVMRTQEDVLLDDATFENPFSSDSYIVQSRPHSILCLPLINQGKLIGILYLENKLTGRVFTANRTAILKVLASQAAVALENSRLYRDLENRERRIRRLIDSNVIGIVLWDLDGTLLDANDAFLRMVGYDHEDVKAGIRWFDMTPPEWQEVHARYEAEELLATGMMQPREKEYFRKDGSRVPVLIGAACFEDQPNQGVAYILDLTQQKRAEAALRRSEAYLAEAQKQTHTGSCAIDGRSRETIYWSDEMFRLFGTDPQHGPPMWDRFVEQIHPDDRVKFRQASERLFRAKVPCDIEYRVLKPDGSVRYIHGIGQPVVSSSGELTEVLGTMVDITERKQAEENSEKLRQAQLDLAHVTRVSTMGELTASLAHEIKQPIGAAVTNAEACVRLIDRSEPDLPEAREAALEMIKDARRAADIIDRVRSLYQKGSALSEPVDLRQLIGEMVGLMSDDAGRHGVTIRTDVQQGLPTILGDRVQLQQALMNLMLNGIEAMQESGGTLQLKVGGSPDGPLVVSVEDTGAGVNPENSRKIFDAFFTTKTTGTGLGLAITRSIVQAHGGRIWVTSMPGRGATFHFTLPLDREAGA